MSWPRGLQSAIFWYASCAPCVERKYAKERKRDAIRGREMREAWAAEMPGMYRHPSPASTNPHWQAEIDAGPVLLARGRKKTNTSGNNNGKNSGKNSKDLKRGPTQSSNDSGLPSSVDLSLNGGSRDGRADSKLHFQQFQRDDEQGPLTSLSREELASNSTLDGWSSRSRITRPTRALMTDDPSYIPHRNPQLNDLHPATVTKIASRNEAKWLMAPQPTADFMEGKDRGSRARSDSGGSSRISGKSSMPLSREMSLRIMERRAKNGDVPLVPTLSRETTSLSSNSPKGQNHDRDDVEERDFALDSSPKVRPRRPSLLGQNPTSEESTESTATVIRKPNLEPEAIRGSRYASPPQLSTIASDNYMSFKAQVPKENIRHSDDSVPERDRFARRSPVSKDDSLRVLRELAPSSPIFRSHIVSTQDLTEGGTKRGRRSPDQASEGAPEMIDSWYTADFSSPDWIHEHTKREVNHRWSMDI